MKSMWSPSRDSRSFDDLKRALGKHDVKYQTDEQQDVAELFTEIIQWIEDTTFQEMMTGSFRHTTICNSCNTANVQEEAFRTLTLEVPDRHEKIDVAELLDRYFKEEKLEGRECGNCKSKKDSIKKTEILSMPRVVTINLRRLTYDPEKQKIMKIKTVVNFGPQLALDRWLAEANKGSKPLELSGVGIHQGGVSSGHYMGKFIELDSISKKLTFIFISSIVPSW
jgi:ubiquitin C-terminal hydrolase